MEWANKIIEFFLLLLDFNEKKVQEVENVPLMRLKIVLRKYSNSENSTSILTIGSQVSALEVETVLERPHMPGMHSKFTIMC